MLEKNSIFFSRANEQTDNLEGEYPEGMVAELERIFEDGFPSDDGKVYTFREWHNQKEIPSRLISCWCAGTTESRRMWTEYTNSEESIAVCSTVGRLKNCFHDPIEPVVWIGNVRYGKKENRLSNSRHIRNVNFWLYPFFAKRDSYTWENEVRATVNLALRKQALLAHSKKGCYVKADLHILIESVYIHPQLRDVLREQVGAKLANYGFRNVEIYQSQ